MAITTKTAKNTSDLDEMLACARNQNPDVRYSLTLNPEVTNEILGILSNDPDPDVRESAQARMTGVVSEQDKYETSYAKKPTIFITTTPEIPGASITTTLGLVTGSSSKIALGFNKQSERLDLALDNALFDLEKQARILGANAVVGLQIVANSSQGASAAFMGSSEGIVALGTAVIADLN